MLRDRPDITTDEIGRKLIAWAKVLEEHPIWVETVPKLKETLVISAVMGEMPQEGYLSARFLTMNAIAENPHVLFV